MGMKRLLLVMGLLIYTSMIFAQKFNDGKYSSLSFHAGYANMVKGTNGLTKTTKEYEDKLRSGISWDFEYDFHPIKILGIGMIYSGCFAKAAHEEGSDRVHTHYIAPQIRLYLFENARWEIRMMAGAGCMIYRNNSKVFSKSRKAGGTNLGLNAGLNIAYKLDEHWAISLSAQYIESNLSKMNVDYHDERFIVRYESDNKLEASRINISGGLSFRF